MNICLQCALKAFVEAHENLTSNAFVPDQPNTQMGRFTESFEEHLKQKHSNPEETQRERADLERRAEAIIAKHKSLAENAGSN